MESAAPLDMAVPFRTTNGCSKRGLVAIVNCDNSGSVWLPLFAEVWLAISVAGSLFTFSSGGEVAGPGELGVLLAVEDISWARQAKRMESWSCARTKWTTSKTKHVRPWGKPDTTVAYVVWPVRPWHQVFVDLEIAMLQDRGHPPHTVPVPHARH